MVIYGHIAGPRPFASGDLIGPETVLGVIDAFIGIATKGSGNIGAVAPGVAEALIATAAGVGCLAWLLWKFRTVLPSSARRA